MQNQAKLNVAIAEDNEIFAKGLQTIVSVHPLLNYVGTYHDGSDILEAVASLVPELNLIFMDVCMPRMDGIEATKRIKTDYPEIKIVAMSMFDEVKLIEEMFEAGADSYILKDDIKIKKLDELVNEFMSNKRYISPIAATKYALHVLNKSDKSTPTTGDKKFEVRKLKNGYHITQREMEIIGCIKAGMTNQQMSDKLNISCSTINTHKKNIMTKTGAQSSLQIAKWANESGML